MQTLDKFPRLDALTSLRFYAAIMLVFFHVDLLLFDNKYFATFALRQGVSFFFVLSGFILFYNYRRLDTKESVCRFFIARFARIWPALAFTTFLMVLVLPYKRIALAKGMHLFWIVMSELFMVQSWIPNWKYFLGINPPTWSISTEVGFYLIFPFLIMNWNKTWWQKLTGAGLLTAIFIGIGSWFYRSGPSEALNFLEQWLLYINPMTRLFEFVLGMVVVGYFLKVRSAFDKENRKATKLISIAQILSLILVLVVIAKCEHWATIFPFSLAVWIQSCGGCFAFASLIFFVAFSEGIVARLLQNSVAVWLGEISYSIYLLHCVLLVYIYYHKEIGVLNFNDPSALSAVLTAFTVALIGSSALIYFVIEKPARRFITKRLTEIFVKVPTTIA